MEKGATLDETALIVVTHVSFSYWTTNWEHKIGMCSLLLGLTGNMEFTVLEYCTKQSATNKDNKVIENNLNMVDHHNTSTDSSSSLSDKLSGVSNPEKISSPKKPKKSFVFVQHGVRQQNKRVRKFNCMLCTDTFSTQKELNAHIATDHKGF